MNALMRGVAAALIALSPALARAAGEQPAGAAEQMKARLRANDVEAAIEIGERETGKSPDDSILWQMLGEAYGSKARSASVFSQMGLARKCRTAFEKAVALDPKNVAARMDLFEYLLEAPGIAGGSKDKAREQAAEIMKLDAVQGHTALASLAVDEKDAPRAEAEFRKALAAAPGNLRARVALGTFFINQKRLPEAKALFEEVLPDPKLSMIAHYQLGKVLFVSGKGLDEALGHFKAYLGAPPEPGTPSWADAQWRIGLVYEKLGKNAEAVAALKEALRLNPAHPQAKKDLKRLGG